MYIAGMGIVFNRGRGAHLLSYYLALNNGH